MGSAPTTKPLHSIAGDRRLRVAALVLLALVALVGLLSVNTFPLVGNDSLLYIDHSRDFGRVGWVQFGYRQAGYPAFLAAVRQVSELFGAEPLLAVAVLQRVLLVTAGILAFWLWRWASLPLVILLLAAQTIGLTNFVLVEGLGPPLALLLAIAATIFVRASRRPGSTALALRLSSGIVVAGGVVLLFAMRVSFVGFVLVPFALLRAAWDSTFRRWSVALVGVVSVAVLGLVIVLSIENEVEYGLPSPTVNSEWAAYYYAWAQIFWTHPENRTDPGLSRFWDEGEIWDFIREMDASGLDYRSQRPLYEQEITAMLEAAGTSPWRARIESTLWTLAGGRVDDIGIAMRAVLSSTRHNVDQVIAYNTFASRQGLEAFARRYNDSRLPEAVITDKIAKPPPVPNAQGLLRILTPLAVMVMALGLYPRETGSIAAMGLLVVVTSAVGLGFLLADNYRFLVTPSVFGIGIATEVAVVLMSTSRRGGEDSLIKG